VHGGSRWYTQAFRIARGIARYNATTESFPSAIQARGRGGSGRGGGGGGSGRRGRGRRGGGGGAVGRVRRERIE